jgi:predicted MPP superfamily phosphohydrolase
MKQKANKRLTLSVTVIVLAVLLFLITAEALHSNLSLTVSRYTVRSEKVSGALRIVFLSDLHGREFGTGNARLLELIAAEQPDLIALVGDIFNNNADADEIDRMCGLIQKAAEIAPVYFSLGNHEDGYAQSHDADILERVRHSGAVVLDNEYLDLELRGSPIRIGGYMGYYRQPHMMTADPEQIIQERAFADDLESTDRFKLLLNHIPTAWLDWHYIDKYPVDLVLSGHYHGGLIRIPFLEQGVYAPYVGLFPPFTKGKFEGSEATCILTTGLAGKKLPRFFNPPEIVVADIVDSE